MRVTPDIKFFRIIKGKILYIFKNKCLKSHLEIRREVEMSVVPFLFIVGVGHGYYTRND